MGPATEEAPLVFPTNVSVIAVELNGGTPMKVLGAKKAHMGRSSHSDSLDPNILKMRLVTLKCLSNQTKPRLC